MQYSEARARRTREEGAEVRAWRLMQRLPSGRAMRIADLARAVGTQEEVVGRYERGNRMAPKAVRARIWALMLASRVALRRPAGRLELKPPAKCGELEGVGEVGEQLELPAFA